MGDDLWKKVFLVLDFDWQKVLLEKATNRMNMLRGRHVRVTAVARCAMSLFTVSNFNFYLFSVRLSMGENLNVS